MLFPRAVKNYGKLSGKSEMRIIPVFIPHSGCKSRCTFCNEYSATGFSRGPDESQIRNIVLEYRSYFKYKDHVQLGFYGGTFTGNIPSVMEEYLNIALNLYEEKLIHGIRFSTSPDEIDGEKIKILRRYPVEMIELGVESFDDEVLKRSERPHGVEEIYESVKLVKENDIPFGIHLMTDLPFSSEDKDFDSALKTVELKPDLVRIHPTVVLKGSALEKEYLNGKYVPKSLAETIEQLWKIYVLFRSSDIIVSRIGICLYGEQKKSVVAGPFHEALGDIVKSRVYYEVLMEILRRKGRIEIPISQKNIFTGYKKGILKKLNENSIDYTLCEMEKINIEYYIRMLSSELLGGVK